MYYGRFWRRNDGRKCRTKMVKGDINMLEKITKILQDYKSDPSLEVSESSSFEGLELDSLDLMQLIMDVEEAFDVTIDVSTQPITTVSELMDVIKKVQG